MGVVFSMCDIVYQYCWCIDGLVLSGKCGDNEPLHVHSTDKRSVECDSSRSEVWCASGVLYHQAGQSCTDALAAYDISESY